MNKYIEQEAIHYCNEVPFMRVLILCASYRQVKQYIDDFAELDLSDLCTLRKSHNEITFPNGSRISLGFCSKDDDVFNYAGCQYGFVYVDSEVESDFIIRYIRSRVRMAKTHTPKELVGTVPKSTCGSR